MSSSGRRMAKTIVVSPSSFFFLFSASSSIATIAAHAHVGCIVSSHLQSSAFMSYAVPSRVPFVDLRVKDVDAGSVGPSMAHE